MEKIIKTAVYQLVLNEKSTLLYCVGNKVNIFDVANNFKKNKVLDDLKNPNQVFYDESLEILIVKNTTGSFAIYNLNNYQILRKFDLENAYSTNHDFFYERDNKILYIIDTFYEENNLKNKLVLIDLKKQKIDYIPLENDKGNRVYVFYSIQKIEAQYLFLYKSIIDTNKAKVIESTYGKYTIENNNLINLEILWKSYFDFGRMKVINENYGYGYDCIVDVSQQKAYPLEKIKRRLSKIPIYNMSYYNGKLAIVTSDKIYFTEDFEHIMDTIDGEYLSCYLETDEYKFIGSWENLKIVSKN